MPITTKARNPFRPRNTRANQVEALTAAFPLLRIVPPRIPWETRFILDDKSQLICLAKVTHCHAPRLSDSVNPRRRRSGKIFPRWVQSDTMSVLFRWFVVLFYPTSIEAFYP